MAYPYAWAAAAAVLAISNSGARDIGPSFDRSNAETPGQKLICSNADLSRTELAYAQAYHALRQQFGEAGWQSLKLEANAPESHDLQLCGIPASGPLPANTANRAGCLAQGYERRRAVWVSRLTGPAADEARRPLEQHVVLQRKLQALGFLPADAAVDGVYGAATRSAISAWQHATTGDSNRSPRSSRVLGDRRIQGGGKGDECQIFRGWYKSVEVTGLILATTVRARKLPPAARSRGRLSRRGA